MDNNESKLKAYEEGKRYAMILGAVVYFAAVVLVLVFSETLITANMTGFFRIVAQLALVLVAMNSLAIPVGLHYWAVSGLHRWAAIISYAVDIIFMGVNAVVAFGYIQGHMPEWGTAYLPYVPLAMVVAIGEWAIMYILDPGAVAIIQLAQARQDAELAVVQQVRNYIKSDTGKVATIESAAQHVVNDMFSPESLAGKVASRIGGVATKTLEVKPAPNGHKEGMANFTKQP